jgi:radical SAM superfamily enzyme YgiQ (UPF0313 family)
VGGANLGFQSIYHFLNSDPRFTAERFFLESLAARETRGAAKSLDSGRPLSSFPVIAFSIPFESDYPAVPTLLGVSGIPPLAQDRNADHPLVLAGGISVSLNPEPLAPFMDLIWIGEFDETGVGPREGVFSALRRLIGAGRRRSRLSRASLLREFRFLESVYVPSGYDVSLTPEGIVTEIRERSGFPPRVKARKLSAEESPIPHSVMFSPDAQFGDSLLLEVNRGCSRGCRFCAGGWIHHPVRYRSYASFKDIADLGVRQGRTVGLVGSDLAGHPELEDILTAVTAQGGKFSLSSIRPEGLTPAVVDLLRKTGHRTATLAPETASLRLKAKIGKRIPSSTFLELTETLVRSGVPNVRYYFMIGLPSEEDEDVEALVEFVMQAREVFAHASQKMGAIGRIGVQVNPFVPKPWTPFQWTAMAAPETLERRIGIIHHGLRAVSNITLRVESLRQAPFQALLSRGTRNLASVILHAANSGFHRPRKTDSLRVALDALVYRERPKDEPFPWDVVDHGVSRETLWKVFEKKSAQPPSG